MRASSHSQLGKALGLSTALWGLCLWYTSNMRICEVPGCTMKHMARGMCVTHYARWRDGRPMDGTRRRPQPDIKPLAQTKLCPECNKILDRASFYVVNSKSGAMSVYCRVCTRLRLGARQYGLTPKKYKELLSGECWICGRRDNLCIDHDHNCCAYGKSPTCGKCVRGVLCVTCNTGLGKLEKNLARATEYVRRFSVGTRSAS